MLAAVADVDDRDTSRVDKGDSPAAGRPRECGVVGVRVHIGGRRHTAERGTVRLDHVDPVSLLHIAPMALPVRPRVSEPDRNGNCTPVRRPLRLHVVRVRYADVADDGLSPAPAPGDEYQIAVRLIGRATDERNTSAIRRPG